MPDYSNNYMMYSVTNKWAVGIDQWRFGQEKKNNELALMKLNHLLWRHNGEDSQSNAYLHAGYGVEDQEFSRKNTRGAFLLGGEGDFETRDYFTSFKYYQFSELALSQARIGLSPSRQPFDKLQTWLMLQGMHIKDLKEAVMVTPLVRFFYQNVMWEMGSSTRGEWMLNFMVHY